MRFARGKRPHRLGLVTAVIVLAMSLVVVAKAAAELRSGAATDPVESGPGSEERIEPGQDIVAVNANYDTTAGTVTATVTTNGAPTTSNSFLLVRFSTVEDGECVRPRVFLGASYSSGSGEWLIEDTSGGSTSPATATKSIAGNATTLTATATALANQPYACAEAYVLDETQPSGEQVLEGLTAPIQLVGPPPPPPPASPPPSTPTTPPPAPAPTPRANLVVSPKTVIVHRNKWKKVTVKITNTGDAAAGKVALKIGKARGVGIKPKSGKLKLKSIAAGKSKVASFKVQLTKKAKARSKLTLTISGAKGVKASGLLTLEAWKKPRPKKGKKGEKPPVPANPPLAEKIFYAYKTETSHSATLIGYAFIDGEWAYHGIPTDGLPSCTEVTGNAEKEGCVKYRYDPASGTVQIGSLTGKISAGGALELDGESYFATSTPAAGTRLQVEQEFIGYSGLCGLIFGCTTWHEHLMLNNNGEFVLSKESLTTVGGSGPGETFIAAGSYPPDQHGTYAIEKGARIKLSFADGTTDTMTFAIFLNKEGKPDPTNAGVLLGTDYFTFTGSE
jgi:hypothetical protein